MDEITHKANQLLALSYRLFDRPKAEENDEIRFYMLIIEEFDDVDIEDEFIQYYAWTLDNPSPKRSGFRCGLRNWLKRANKMA